MSSQSTKSTGEITALIRVQNSASTLPLTLRSLAQQLDTPASYVFVDSGSTDQTLDLIPRNSIVHHYAGSSFNYAEALNQGLAYVSTPLTLIISSHTTLGNPEALSYAVGLLERDSDLGAAYFTSEAGKLRHVVVDAGSFDGFNGLWNTCALVRMHLLDERRFRTEVFAAEDQEWSRWLFQEKGLKTARVAGAGMCNDANPRLRDGRHAKWRREYLAIAIYVRPELLRFPRLLGPLRAAATLGRRTSVRERVGNVLLFIQLLGVKYGVGQVCLEACRAARLPIDGGLPSRASRGRTPARVPSRRGGEG